MTMTHETMLAAITRELVRTEIQIHAQNPEMALGMAMARRIMERQYSEKLAHLTWHSKQKPNETRI